MDSEQLRLLRRIGAVDRQLGTALKSTGGRVSGGLEVEDRLMAAGGMAVTGGMAVSGQFKAAGAFTAGNGRLVVPADSVGALVLKGALKIGDGRLVVPANSAQDMTIDGEKIWHAGNMRMEEGTWTPRMFGTTAGTAATDRAGGSYIRIGGLVYCGFRIRTTSTSGISGYVRVGGLPFITASVSSVSSITCTAFTAGFTAAGITYVVPVAAANADYMSLYKQTVSSNVLAQTLVDSTNLSSTICEINATLCYRI